MISRAAQRILLLTVLPGLGMPAQAPTLCFPPLTGIAWEEVAPDDLGWDVADFHDPSVLICV